MQKEVKPKDAVKLTPRTVPTAVGLYGAVTKPVHCGIRHPILPVLCKERNVIEREWPNVTQAKLPTEKGSQWGSLRSGSAARRWNPTEGPLEIGGRLVQPTPSIPVEQDMEQNSIHLGDPKHREDGGGHPECMGPRELVGTSLQRRDLRGERAVHG